MKEESQTQMVAKPVQKRMTSSWTTLEPRESLKRTVKARVLTDINIQYGKDDNQYLHEGEEVMLTEEEAKEFCDREFSGFHAFRGERSVEDSPRYKTRRAERVK